MSHSVPPHEADSLPAFLSHPGSTEQYRWHEFPLGLDEDGAVVTWDTSHTPHAHIVGPPGGGKTVAVRSVLKHCLNHLDNWDVFVVDAYPEQITETHLSALDRVVQTSRETADFLGDLVLIMKERQSYMRQQNLPAWAGKRILLVAESLEGFISVDPEGETARTLTRHLSSLVSRGRATGIHVLISTQRVKPLEYDTLMQMNLEFRIAFGPISEEGAQKFFSDSAVASRSSKIKGRGIVADRWSGDDPRVFQAYGISPDLDPLEPTAH